MNYDKLKATELFLFDMDGTLYLGDNVYPGAIELIDLFDACGDGDRFQTLAPLECAVADLSNGFGNVDRLDQCAVEGVIADSGQVLGQLDLLQMVASVKGIVANDLDGFGNVNAMDPVAAIKCTVTDHFQTFGQIDFIESFTTLKGIVANNL